MKLYSYMKAQMMIEPRYNTTRPQHAHNQYITCPNTVATLHFSTHYIGATVPIVPQQSTQIKEPSRHITWADSSSESESLCNNDQPKLNA